VGILLMEKIYTSLLQESAFAKNVLGFGRNFFDLGLQNLLMLPAGLMESGCEIWRKTWRALVGQISTND